MTQQSTHAAQIIAKLKALGIPEIPSHWSCHLPTASPFAVFKIGWGEVLLRVRHAPNEITVWFQAPAADTVVGMGEAPERYGSSTPMAHPFCQPMPPVVELQLAPIWNQLGITYRRATTAELFQDASQLVGMAGVYKKIGAPRIKGVYVLVTHKIIWRVKGTADIKTTVAEALKNHTGDEDQLYNHNTACPVSTVVMQQPLVAQALATGNWPLIVSTGELDQVLVSGGNWRLLPW